MSSHCHRYPCCGCNSYVGAKCHLPDGDQRLQEMELDPFEKTLEEKKKELEAFKKELGIGSINKVKRGSNYTPPKRKRK